MAQSMLFSLVAWKSSLPLQGHENAKSSRWKRVRKFTMLYVRIKDEWEFGSVDQTEKSTSDEMHGWIIIAYAIYTWFMRGNLIEEK